MDQYGIAAAAAVLCFLSIIGNRSPFAGGGGLSCFLFSKITISPKRPLSEILLVVIVINAKQN